MSQSIEAEQEQQEETRRLRQQLEESRRENSRLGLERDELARNLEEKEKDRDAVRKENTQLDDQRRQQERALDKLNKEVCAHQHKFESVLCHFSLLLVGLLLSVISNLLLLLPPAPFPHFFYVRWNACLHHPVRRCGSCRLSWMSRERSGGKSSRT